MANHQDILQRKVARNISHSEARIRTIGQHSLGLVCPARTVSHSREVQGAGFVTALFCTLRRLGGRATLGSRSGRHNYRADGGP